MALVNEQNLLVNHYEEAVQITPQQKVFTNILLLSEITKLLHSKKNLESFRLTNQACIQASSLFWRKSTCAQLLLLQTYREERNIHKFMELVDEMKPHYNLKLTDWFIHPASNRGRNFRRTVNYFWNMCGVNMKHLTLSNCKFEESRLVSVVCNFAPNLESLKIEGSADDYLFYRKELKQSEEFRPHRNLRVLHVISHTWLPNWQFLEYFPNLVELKLLQPFNLIQRADTNILSALCILRQKYHGFILKLKVLEVNINESFLDNLATARLPLEHLSLNLSGYMDTTKFRKMMSTVSGTLKYLKLHRLPFRRHPFQSSFIVNFAVLEELHLCGRLVSNFNFLKETPALKKLVVDWSLGGFFSHKCFPNMVNDSNMLMDTPNFEHLSLKHFEVDHEFTVESLQILGKWFPNLEKLTTVLNDETLATVRQQWTKLVDLQLSWGSNVTEDCSRVSAMD